MGRDAFLSGRRIAVLATENADGTPYLNAMWFAWQDGVFLFPTASSSRKARNARERPRASVVVDARGGAVHGVAASGRIEVITGDEALAINARVHRHYVSDAGMLEPALGVQLSAMDDVTLRLTPERWREWDVSSDFGDDDAYRRLVHPLDP